MMNEWGLWLDHEKRLYRYPYYFCSCLFTSWYYSVLREAEEKEHPGFMDRPETWGAKLNVMECSYAATSIPSRILHILLTTILSSQPVSGWHWLWQGLRLLTLSKDFNHSTWFGSWKINAYHVWRSVHFNEMNWITNWLWEILESDLKGKNFLSEIWGIWNLERKLE